MEYIQLLDNSRKQKDIMLINFKLNRHVVEVLDQLVVTGLYKTRVDVILSALRTYEPFKGLVLLKRSLGDSN